LSRMLTCRRRSIAIPGCFNAPTNCTVAGRCAFSSII
jgi:hypothetical protein